MPQITANAGAVQLLGVDGAGSIGVQITGTWVGTLAFQMSMDGGATWNAVNAWPVSAGATVQSTTANGNWAIPCVAGTYYQVVATAWTSGTAVVTLQTIKNPIVLAPKTNASGELIVSVSAAGGVTSVQGTAADGATASGNPVQVGGVDGSGNAQALGVGTTGGIVPGQQTATGSLGALNAAVTLSTLAGAPYVLVQFEGTTPSLIVTYEITNDGTNWRPATSLQQPIPTASSGSTTTSNPAAQTMYLVATAGAAQMRVRCSTYTSGTITATLGSSWAGTWGSPTAGQGSSGQPKIIGAASMSIDTEAASSYTGLVCGSVPWLLNSSNQFERARAAKADGSAVGTVGIPASAIHGWDGAAYSGCKVESAAQPNLRVGLYNGAVEAAVGTAADGGSLNSALRAQTIGMGYNGASADLLRTASATAAAGGTTGFLATALMTWNGTGYQPAQGDTTGTPRVGVYQASIKIASTVQAAAYATGDLIGGKQTITSAARISGGTGHIRAISIGDQNANSVANSVYDLIIWDADPSGTTFTENSALDVADADLNKQIAVVRFDGADGSTRFANADNAILYKAVDIPFVASGSANLFCALIARGGPTYAATTDVFINVQIDQN